jgi:pimeloyl-ACP methyl ester carboxylesterase
MPIAPIPDLDLHYEEQGSGEPVVLIGDFAQPRSAWGGLRDALAERFRVVSFDSRGTGESGQPDVPFRLDAMVGDVLGLLDHLEIEKAALVGVGLGGAVAREVARQHPGRVQKLVLAGDAPHLDGFARTLLQNLADLRRSSIPDVQFLQYLAFFLHGRSFFEGERSLATAADGMAAYYYPRLDYGFLRQVDAALAFDASDEPLEGIRPDALVVGAKEDAFIAPALAKELAEALPNAEYRELPGGHHGFVEHPEEWGRVLAEFLRN